MGDANKPATTFGYVARKVGKRGIQCHSPAGLQSAIEAESARTRGQVRVDQWLRRGRSQSQTIEGIDNSGKRNTIRLIAPEFEVEVNRAHRLPSDETAHTKKEKIMITNEGVEIVTACESNRIGLHKATEVGRVKSVTHVDEHFHEPS